MSQRSPILSLVVAASLSACVFDNPGSPPRDRAFHFPIAAVASPDARWLYVVNSDFNLQYNGGSIVVVDLSRVRDAILGPAGSPRPVTVTPPPAAPSARQIDPESVWMPPLQGENGPTTIRINPFATDVQLRTVGAARRLYVTVRGDATLTYVDLVGDGSTLSCGASAPNELCAIDYRRGIDPTQHSGPRQLSLPPLPAVVNTRDGDPYVVVVHQESPRSRISLFYDAVDRTDVGPILTHWVGDMSSNLDAIVRLEDIPGVGGAAAQPRWIAFSRDEPFANYVHAVPDGPLSFLARSRLVPFGGVASDVGIRTLVRDPANPNRLYATARPGPSVGGSPIRSGEQLLSIDLSVPETPIVTDILAIPAGISRLTAIRDPDPAGAGHTLVYVVSFDSRTITVVDANAWRVIDSIRTQFGPHVIVPDPLIGEPDHRHDFLYLVDFGSNCVEVVDVGFGPNHAATHHRVVMTIGDVSRPRENL